jgi:hypothetical protein
VVAKRSIRSVVAWVWRYKKWDGMKENGKCKDLHKERKEL